MFAKPDTKIYASSVKPGMIVETEAGVQISVTRVAEGFGTIKLTDITGGVTVVEHGEMVIFKYEFNV